MNRVKRPEGVPKMLRGWAVRSCIVGDYYKGGRIVMWWGEFPERWISVDWRSGASLVVGPMHAAELTQTLSADHGGRIVSFLSKPTAGGPSGRGGGSAVTGVLAALPALLEYLSAEQYPDGSSRERATLMLLVEDGLCKVCLSDRDTGRSLWRAGQRLEEALKSLEEALSGANPDWRRSSGGQGFAKKKGGKG